MEALKKGFGGLDDTEIQRRLIRYMWEQQKETECLERTRLTVKSLRSDDLNRDDAIAFFNASDALCSPHGRAALFQMAGLTPLMTPEAEKKAMNAGGSEGLQELRNRRQQMCSKALERAR